MQDRQHRAVARRIQKLVGMPAGRKRPGLGLPVADDAGDDQIRVVEGRAVRVRQGVTELAPLVNGAGRLGRDVTRDPAGEAELLEQLLHAVRILGDAGVDLAVRTFEVRIGDQAWAAVPGPDDVDHVEVVFLDDPVQVDVEKVQARRRPPVAEQAGFDVRALERLLQEWIVVQIDLADREVVGGPPVGVHLAQLVRR